MAKSSVEGASNRYQRRLGLRLKRRRYQGAEVRPHKKNRFAGGASGRPKSAEAPATGQAEQTIEKQKEQLMRMQAEFENYRRRMQRDMKNIKETANAKLLEKLLPVLDNFARAFQSPGDSLESFLDGIKMIESHLETLLGEAGLEKIDVIGQEFDPQFHEAVLADSSGDHPDNQIIEVMQEGYSLKGRLLRPAMVKVSRSE